MTDPAWALPDPDDLYPDHPDVDAETDTLHALYPDGVADMAAAIAQADDDAVWRIPDDSAAEWAMGKLAEAEAQLATLDAQLREYTQRAGAWHVRVTTMPLRDRVYFAGLLSEYAQRRRSESGGKVKTLRLPSGEVATRKGQAPRPQIEDPAAVLAWALDMRDGGRTGLVRVRMLIDVLLSDVAKQVDVVPMPGDDDGYRVVDRQTGEVVPGMGWAQTPPSATAKPYETA